MSRFAVAKYDLVLGVVPFYKLLVNGRCPYDEFWDNIEQEGNLRGQLHRMISLMDRYANKLPLPDRKFKSISRSSSGSMLYEFKTRDLRVYFMRDPFNAIIVLGGKKSTQKHDIRRFINLANEYYQETKP